MTKLFGEAKIPNVDVSNLHLQDPEFQELVLNLINIHVVSEDYGADCFERSIMRGPTPEFKMRMARTVMEEYGHHLRFRRLLEELQIDWREIMKAKEHLTTFDVPIETWADQMVFLALVDRAAAHQFEEFIHSPYAPFRQACKDTLREEHGHVGCGMKGTKYLIEKTSYGWAEVGAAVKKWLPIGLQSFGGDASKSNARYRYWGIKGRTNEDMRQEYFADVMLIIRDKWGISVPDKLEDWWDGKTAQASDDSGYKYVGLKIPGS